MPFNLDGSAIRLTAQAVRLTDPEARSVVQALAESFHGAPPTVIVNRPIDAVIDMLEHGRLRSAWDRPVDPRDELQLHYMQKRGKVEAELGLPRGTVYGSLHWQAPVGARDALDAAAWLGHRSYGRVAIVGHPRVIETSTFAPDDSMVINMGGAPFSVLPDLVLDRLGTSRGVDALAKGPESLAMAVREELRGPGYVEVQVPEFTIDDVAELRLAPRDAMFHDVPDEHLLPRLEQLALAHGIELHRPRPGRGGLA